MSFLRLFIAQEKKLLQVPNLISTSYETILREEDEQTKFSNAHLYLLIGREVCWVGKMEGGNLQEEKHLSATISQDHKRGKKTTRTNQGSLKPMASMPIGSRTDPGGVNAGVGQAQGSRKGSAQPSPAQQMLLHCPSHTPPPPPVLVMEKEQEHTESSSLCSELRVIEKDKQVFDKVESLREAMYILHYIDQKVGKAGSR